MYRMTKRNSNRAFEFQRLVWEASSCAELAAVALRIAHAYGFAGYRLALDRKYTGDANQFLYMHNWPAERMDEFVKLSLSDKDPHPRILESQSGPHCWNGDSFGGDDRATFVCDVTKQYDIKSGVIIPLRLDLGINAFSLHSHENRCELKSEELLELSFLAMCLYDKAMEQNNKDCVDERLSRLNDTQTEVLKWIAVGKTNFEIAIILDMSVRNVNFHVSSIIQKLEVYNRLQAANIYLSR